MSDPYDYRALVERDRNELLRLRDENAELKQELKAAQSGIVKMKVKCRDGIRHAIEVYYSRKPAPFDPMDYTIGEKDSAGQAFITAADGTWMWGTSWVTAVFGKAHELKRQLEAVQAEAKRIVETVKHTDALINTEEQHIRDKLEKKLLAAQAEAAQLRITGQQLLHLIDHEMPPDFGVNGNIAPDGTDEGKALTYRFIEDSRKTIERSDAGANLLKRLEATEKDAVSWQTRYESSQEALREVIGNLAEIGELLGGDGDAVQKAQTVRMTLDAMAAKVAALYSLINTTSQALIKAFPGRAIVINTAQPESFAYYIEMLVKEVSALRDVVALAREVVKQWHKHTSTVPEQRSMPPQLMSKLQNTIAKLDAEKNK